MSFRHPNTWPLIAPVSAAGLRRWRQDAQQAGTWSSPWVENAAGRAGSVLGVLVISLLVPGLVLLRTADLTVTAIALLVPAGATAGVLLIWELAAARLETRACRLDGFAAANGLQQRRDRAAPNYPGMILNQGTDRRVVELLQTLPRAPRFVEFGNYSCTLEEDRHGRREETSAFGWGYVAIRLEHALPNIVLDAKGNDALLGSNLPIAPTRRQRLSLEGDFDRYFTLYAPAGYEADALYLFTPDVMVTFIDEAAFLDAEIVDHWLLLYSQHDIVTLDPDRWTKLFAAVSALDARLDQWARWHDDRLPRPRRTLTGGLQPQPLVAPPGRRLRTHRGQRVQTVVFTLVYLAVMAAFAWFSPR
jgi:hypothetical protein